MEREFLATGKTVEEAIEAAYEKAGVDREFVTVEIISKPTSPIKWNGSNNTTIVITAKYKTELLITFTVIQSFAGSSLLYNTFDKITKFLIKIARLAKKHRIKL